MFDPLFAVVVPREVDELPIVYQVAPGNHSLLRAINDWLALEGATGGIDELYDYSVEGKTEQVDPPRWSVIRDVLG